MPVVVAIGAIVASQAAIFDSCFSNSCVDIFPLVHCCSYIS
jgi:hypothetical protein